MTIYWTAGSRSCCSPACTNTTGAHFQHSF